MTDSDQPASAPFLALIAAPNGARRGPGDQPAVPITPAELALCAEALLAEDVSVFHLHVRNAAGEHSLAPAFYREAIAAIRARVGDRLVIQATTEAVGRYTRQEQMAAVRELRPEAVSLSLRELCPDEAAEAEAATFFAWCRRESIWPQYILYSPDDLSRFEQLRRRGLFAEERPSCLFVAGRYAEQLTGTADELDAFLAAADCSQFPWAACCFGRHENAVMLAAAAAGGHVRLGFENNTVLCDGTPARDNAELFAQFRKSARHLGRRPATADEIRSQWQQ